MINEQVVLNLRLSPDSPGVHERLTFLDRFLEAVGENPPDELVGLSREVSQAYHKAKPQMEQKLSTSWAFSKCFFVFFGWSRWSSLKAFQSLVRETRQSCIQFRNFVESLLWHPLVSLR